jgi:hypothetical protein
MPRTAAKHALAVLVFAAGVWLFIVGLEAAARHRWLGPVPGNNIARSIDAAALFYTEIDTDRSGDAP